MNISTQMIISNSEMIKNYKNSREMAERLGKIFILKNNQPDAVLFSIAEYERVAVFLEYLESLDEKDIRNFAESLPAIGIRKNYTIDQLRNDIK